VRESPARTLREGGTPPIYLDYNATTPIAPEVLSAMWAFLERDFGNPSSSHVFGRAAHLAVENARAQVAALLRAAPGEILFTGGGTESNNLAIFGAIRALERSGGHLIASAVEHPAVTEVCRRLTAGGWSVTWLPVDGAGRVDPEEVRRSLRADTALVSVMHANNEVGTIQPLAEIAGILRERNVVFHTDAAQSVGKIPCPVDALGVDLLSIAGHKLYAPKGVGALYVRNGIRLEPFMLGAGQERGLRPGTENVAGIVALGAACALAAAEGDRRRTHLEATRDRLWNLLTTDLDDLRLHGDGALRLPNTLSVGFGDVPVPELMARLTGVAASAGSACHGASGTPTATLQAMGVPPRYALGTLRFSTGRPTTAEEVQVAAARIIAAVRAARG
jgi:cysteine desulfurase